MKKKTERFMTSIPSGEIAPSHHPLQTWLNDNGHPEAMVRKELIIIIFCKVES
jgi:hypothetical protein